MFEGFLPCGQIWDLLLQKIRSVIFLVHDLKYGVNCYYFFISFISSTLEYVFNENQTFIFPCFLVIYPISIFYLHREVQI